MEINIRSEKVSDYNALADMIYSSFLNSQPAYYKSEPLITAVLRHSQYYDPELSLVAEVDGKIAGHAFFSPFEFIVLGQKRKGVFLAPLCVDVNYQHQGVGSCLMEAGHKIAKEKGYSMSLLCGIVDYYPRFGYINRAFALSSAVIEMDASYVNIDGVSERPVMQSDLAWIRESWYDLHKNDRLAWFPGDKISQWFNHSLMYCSSVLSLGEKIIGYVKYKKTYPVKINEILVKGDYAPIILAYLLEKQFDRVSGEFIFFMSTEAIRKFMIESKTIRIKRQIWTHDTFMLKILNPNDTLLCRYCSEAKEDEANLGVISFPALLDIDN